MECCSRFVCSAQLRKCNNTTHHTVMTSSNLHGWHWQDISISLTTQQQHLTRRTGHFLKLQCAYCLKINYRTDALSRFVYTFLLLILQSESSDSNDETKRHFKKCANFERAKTSFIFLYTFLLVFERMSLNSQAKPLF